MFLAISIIANAQHEVTRFLGIPVDGSKSEMIRKLQAKGFRYDSSHDCLEGEFNGADVIVSVVTYKDKVRRIGISDVNEVGELDIRLRFNRLCKQFANNPKYLALEDYTISEDEDISYEMTVKNKRYEAAFYQFPMSVKEELSSKYTREQLENPTDEMQFEIFSLIMERTSKMSVWFTISEHYGNYYISMFYDNEYNQANGEDL